MFLPLSPPAAPLRPLPRPSGRGVFFKSATRADDITAQPGVPAVI